MTKCAELRNKVFHNNIINNMLPNIFFINRNASFSCFLLQVLAAVPTDYGSKMHSFLSAK